MKRSIAGMLLLSLLGSYGIADEPVFSGPQPGEKTASFKMRAALGKQKGEMIDPVAAAKNGPQLLIFVHKLTRPSLAVTRTVAEYASNREGFLTAVVLLSNDVTETEKWVGRAARALPQKATVGIYIDGAEGPGAYGLNRNVTLTAIVADEGKAVANFALIQPSVQADAIKIGAAIAKAMGDETAPTAKDLKLPAAPNGDMIDMRSLLAPVINKQATDEQVAAAAQAVEKAFEKDARVKKKVEEIANRIISAGKLANYGTPAAQTYLKKWAGKTE